MRGLSASIVGELLMAVIYPSGVQASGSQSLGSRTFCRSCPPRPHVLKHIKTFFQDMNKTTTKAYVMGGFGVGGGGVVPLNLLLLCRNCEIHIKSPHMSLVQQKNYAP